MKTGYFADVKKYTKVHIVDDNELPICGCRPRGKFFMRCANYAVLDYVDCERCVRICLNKQWKELEEECLDKPFNQSINKPIRP